MEVSHNIKKLEDTIKMILLKYINKKQNLNFIMEELMYEKDYTNLDLESRKQLEIYPKESVHYALEKLLLLSVENSCQSWPKFKEKEEEMRTRILSHFYITLVHDLKHNNFNYEQTKDFEEIKNIYDKKIEKTLVVLPEELKTLVNSSKTITLNHMNNLNANGRTISLDGKKIGGIFLNRNSNIGYSNFVNKKDLLKTFNLSTNKKELRLKDGSITVYEFKKIINSLTQTLIIEKNNNIKNQDARIISDSTKKVGSLFLGNKGIDLANGTYISVDELTKVFNNYLHTKPKEIAQKIVDKKYKLKRMVAVAALATSLFGTAAMPKEVKGYEIENGQDDSSLEVNKVYPEEKKVTVVESKNVTVVQSTPQKVNIINHPKITKDPLQETNEILLKKEIANNTVSENSIISDKIEPEHQIKKEKIEEEIIPQVTVMKKAPEISIPDGSQITGQDIVNYAIQFVGNPYEYGGTDLNNGIDCSAFTQKVYSKFGITLPRTSAEQRVYGIDIGTSLENAIPGDLICYDGHVALYMGNGQIVHAATEKSGIKISRADYGKIVSIRRLIMQKEIETSKIK